LYERYGVPSSSRIGVTVHKFAAQCEKYHHNNELI
jgi:hypothetical protein